MDISNGETKRTNCPVCGGLKHLQPLITWVSLCGIVTRQVAVCLVVLVLHYRDDIRKSLGHVAEETEAVPFHKPEWIVKITMLCRDFCDTWEL